MASQSSAAVQGNEGLSREGNKDGLERQISGGGVGQAKLPPSPQPQHLKQQQQQQQQQQQTLDQTQPHLSKLHMSADALENEIMVSSKPEKGKKEEEGIIEKSPGGRYVRFAEKVRGM